MDTTESKVDIKKSYESLLKSIIDVNEKRLLAMKKINDLQDFIMTKNKLSKLHNADIIDYETDSAEDRPAILTLVDMKNDLKLRRKYTKHQDVPSNHLNIIIPFNSFNIKADYRNYDNNDVKNEKTGKYVDNDKIQSKIDPNGEFDIIFDYKTKKDTKNVFNNKLKRIVINNSDIGYKSDENTDTDKENINARRNWRGSCDKKATKVCRSACVKAHENMCTRFKCSRRAKKAISKECKRSCREKFQTGKYSDSDYEWE